jgi:hypothetical protein
MIYSRVTQNLVKSIYIISSITRLFFHYRKKIDIGKMPIYLIIGLIGVALVTYTGHLGGKMVHRDVQGGFNGGFNGPGGANAHSFKEDQTIRVVHLIQKSPLIKMEM